MSKSENIPTFFLREQWVFLHILFTSLGVHGKAAALLSSIINAEGSFRAYMEQGVGYGRYRAGFFSPYHGARHVDALTPLGYLL